MTVPARPPARRSLTGVPSLLPRLVLALLVLALLARAARVAWSRRDLAVAVWRSIRPRHVLGSLVLLVVVIAVSAASAAAVPVLAHGLGDLLATSGNAVFAPVDVAAEATGADVGGSSATNVAFLAAVTVFLGLLAALLPWFAFVEEEVFRAGAEAWGLPTRVGAALVFGAAHLVMLVPVAAAIGISVAGFAYGELYRRGVASGRGRAPAALRRAFRPTRRSARAVRQLTADVVDERIHVRRQVDGVHASTVWHTAFNTTVVTLVWATFVLDQVVR